MDSSTTRGTALGLSLIALLALSVTLLAECSWAQQLRLSPMVLGVVLGMLLADTLRPRLPEGWNGAFRIAGKQLLRAGIVFYGCRLTLEALTELGPEAILIDTIIVLGTLLLGELLGRALGLERSERLLIASGSAICGAAAVLATEPVVRARSHSTVVAVGTVVLFGTLSMFVYPLLYRWGGAGGPRPARHRHLYGCHGPRGGARRRGRGGDEIRVLLLAPVLLGLSILMRERHAGGSASGKGRVQIPWFACYFILVVLANSLLAHLSSAGGWTASYRTVTDWIQTADTFVLTMAMTAIGMEARLAKFRQSGAKPFLLALGLYLWLVGGGYLLVRLLA